MIVETYVPNDRASGDVWTEEAVAGLVGQRPALSTVPGDWQTIVGRATITAARLDGERIVLTLDVPDEAAERLPGLTERAGIGYAVKAAERAPEGRTVTLADLLHLWRNPEETP